MGRIHYSEKYFDDSFEYRHVVLPPEVVMLLPKNRILSKVLLSLSPSSKIYVKRKACHFQIYFLFRCFSATHCSVHFNLSQLPIMCCPSVC
ncbi:Cyclin-dependent kinases regulatory subunit 1 [Platanthera guangdongensis]|uniref:Cyclin-dependent kinases regulatory subunit n=1 Tax=Platanthera guangdongensis TaxID=2320717 RepID=A0ABR2MA01_9ASPA